MPIHGDAGAAARHRQLERGETRCDRDPRLHDRRRAAAARPNNRHPPSSQGAPSGTKREPACEGRPMSAKRTIDVSPVALLEAIQRQGKEWDVLAPKYGVTNPNPPWKSSLTGTCECSFGRRPAASARPPQGRGCPRRYHLQGSPRPNAICSPSPYMVRRGLVTECDLAPRARARRPLAPSGGLASRRAASGVNVSNSHPTTAAPRMSAAALLSVLGV